jgi:hypothetical protein
MPLNSSVFCQAPFRSKIGRVVCIVGCGMEIEIDVVYEVGGDLSGLGEGVALVFFGRD